MESFPLPPVAFAGHARVVPPESAFSWMRQGWAIFLANPWQWVAMALLWLVVYFGMQIVPVIGTLAANAITPFLIGGMMQAVRRLGDEGAFEFADLFAAFRRNNTQMVIVGVLYMVGWLVIALIVMLLVGGGVAGGIAFRHAGEPELGLSVAFGGVVIAGLITLLLATPLLAMVWFAPALVYFNDMPATTAMKASIEGCLRNWLSMTILSLLVSVLALFAAFLLGLGFLVLIPVVAAAQYVSYRDVFLG